MSLKYTASVIGLGFACLLAAPALAATATGTAQLATERPNPHAMNDMDVASRAIVTATTMAGAAPKIAPFTAESTVSATDMATVDLPTSNTFKTAADAAHESAAVAGTGVCDGYFTQSQALTSNLVPALQAMGKRDLATLGQLLPAMQAQLAGIVASEVKPEACDGTHINAYTDYSYFEISTLRDHGVDIGLPAALPIVKQPDLNQAPLAYTVGWVLYEQQDFPSALAAYSKGLLMFPHDHALQNEYIATLMKLNRGAQTVSYAESVLDGTYDLTDDERAKFFVARAVGLIMMGRLDDADSSFSIALRYNYTDTAKQMQTQLRAARASAAK
jgi:hypothetical protein